MKQNKYLILSKLRNILYEHDDEYDMISDSVDTLMTEAYEYAMGNHNETKSSDFIDKISNITNENRVVCHFYLSESSSNRIDVVFEYSRQPKKVPGQKVNTPKEEKEFQRAFLQFKRKYKFIPGKDTYDETRVHELKQKNADLKKEYEKAKDESDKQQILSQAHKIRKEINLMKSRRSQATSTGTIEINGKRYNVDFRFNPGEFDINTLGTHKQPDISRNDTSVHTTYDKNTGYINSRIILTKDNIINDDIFGLLHEKGHVDLTSQRFLKSTADGIVACFGKAQNTSVLTEKNLSKMLYSKVLSMTNLNDYDELYGELDRFTGKITTKNRMQDNVQKYASKYYGTKIHNDDDLYRLAVSVYKDALKKECDEIAKRSIESLKKDLKDGDVVVNKSTEKDISNRVQKKAMDLLIDRISKKYSKDVGHNRVDEYVADISAISDDPKLLSKMKKSLHIDDNKTKKSIHETSKMASRAQRKYTEKQVYMFTHGDRNKMNPNTRSDLYMDSLASPSRKDYIKRKKKEIAEDHKARQENNRKMNYKRQMSNVKLDDVNKEETESRVKSANDKYNQYYAKKALKK